MSSANELWLEDMSLKLLCVFALDRFGDFVTDEVGIVSVYIFQELNFGLKDANHCDMVILL